MDVRLPDGTMIQGVPDNITKADLTAKLQANGYDVFKLGLVDKSVPDSAPHISPDRPRIWRTFELGVDCGNISNFSAVGLNFTIALAPKSLNHTML